MSSTTTAGRRTGRGLTLLIFAILVLVAFVSTPWSAQATWCAMAACMLAFVLMLGVCISGNALSVLVNEHNRMSLSRFQLVLWTLIVLPAFIAVALKRIGAGPLSIPDPLAIVMPWQLWALMGISTTSLVGTPLINSDKGRRQPTDNALQRSKAGTVPVQARFGTIYVRADNERPDLTDLFQGDEIGNADRIDLAKLQMFFFTVIIALAYVVALWGWMAGTADPAGLAKFPAMGEGLVALLGISHAGYLSSKGVGHTETK